ncbi:uncharacterized protein LOC132637893 [Lycium barbarum]|uniref:uncharacterized protein LOC132637893 n=1 Tax=Lycium barbarum TaxID=112863 RepID=UPI00293F1DC1|nr:uncharacterized protein LOC132637893 [Lycium barbarum]
MDDLNEVLLAGYTINNKPIILKIWNPYFDFTDEFLTEIPLWIKFPHLPVSCWSDDSLGKIASVIGKPLFADECTAKRTRISFARILVEVNTTKPLLDTIVIFDPYGRELEQDVIYDWKPTFYAKCMKLGHQSPPKVRPDPPQPRPRRRRRNQQPTQAWMTKPVQGHPVSRAGITSVPLGESQHQSTVMGRHPTLPMNWLAWNIKGLNKVYKQKELSIYLKDQRIKLAGIVETRVKEHKAPNIVKKVAPTWQNLHNYTHASNGRIWLLWDDSCYQVTHLEASPQLIHVQVICRHTAMKCYMIIIYVFNTVEHRKSLWHQLCDLAQQTTIPWLIWGDFNAVLNIQDRLFGAPVTNVEIKDFQDCVQVLNLTEVKWRGEYYTWTNKQRESDMICSRLDRALGNSEWMLDQGHLEVDFKQPHISDHSPMVMSIKLDEQTTSTPFKFYNIWAEHSNFMKLVEEGWGRQLNRDKMRNVSMKLKALKPVFRELNNEEFRGISYKIITARTKLKVV